MGCARVIALIVGLILLLPGACFLAIGGGMIGGGVDVGAVAVGAAILFVAALMFWGAFAKSDRPPPD